MIENSAGELHFQEFIKKEDNSAIHEIFMRLNADDKDHAKRISFYMEAHGIQLRKGKVL